MAEPFIIRAEVEDLATRQKSVKEWTRDNGPSADRLANALIMEEDNEEPRAPYIVRKLLGIWYKTESGHETQVRTRDGKMS